LYPLVVVPRPALSFLGVRRGGLQPFLVIITVIIQRLLALFIGFALIVFQHII